MNLSSFTLNDLILYCMLRIEQVNEDCTFERLVYECFTTFPERFSFFTYRLPDSIKLDRQLRTVRKLGLITGNNTFGFKLTNIGRVRALQLKKIFYSLKGKLSDVTEVDQKALIPKGGRKEQKMIDKITSSPIFREFVVTGDIKPSVDELRIIFFGTLETPLLGLLDNINYIEEISKKSPLEKVSKFVAFCKKIVEDKLKQ